MDKPRVVLIDLSSLFWAAWHVNHENGVQEARSATLAGVKRCLGEGGDLVAIACDSGKSFRKEISPSYKATRDKQPEASYGELNKTKDRLRADGFLLWEVPLFEADDILATAARKARDLGHEVRVCSADSDLLQLADVRTDILRVHTWEVWTSRTITEKLLIDAEQMTDFKALVGDKSDNIAGAPGIGKIRAAELLTKYTTLARIYEALDAGKQVSTPANEKSLRENRAQVELSRKLVELRFDVPIRFEEIYEERKAKPLEDVDAEIEAMDDSPKESSAAVPAASDSGELTPLTTGVLDHDSSGTTALTVAAPVEFTRQLEPRSFKELVIGCKVLFNAQVYGKYPSYESMVGAALRGREMGYGLGASLDVFHVMDIKGRRSLALHAHAIIDRAMRDPDCEFIECVETTAEKATYEFKRKSREKPFVLTYTIEQARQAQLVKPGSNWEMRPSEQLRKTCGVQGSRVVFPGASMGLYCLAELGIDD